MEQLKMRRDASPASKAIFPAGYSIRSFRPGDEDAWCRCCIDGELGLLECSKAQFDKIMTCDPCVKLENIYLLTAPDGNIAGTITYQSGHANDEGYIHMVGLAKSYWGKRLSLPLVNYAVAKIIEDNNTHIFLTTDDWRLAGIKTYLNAGFIPITDNDEMTTRWQNVRQKLM